ncbi:MAG TPA: D-aminoacyl-tRNA deacylase, partial [Flavobacteriaceae bacterium]|nr:D-aminoacyl-tRNA deacylase [Flavobacteriaceae bacterium]
MRAVIQKVQKATVSIDGSLYSEIGSGLLVLIGITNEDNLDDIVWLSSKICNLRIFEDTNGVMNLSVNDLRGEILIVSQFTLHASTKKGNRPSYIRAAPPEVAIPLYEQFVANVQKNLEKIVKTGKFGAKMEISLINDGPVTILIDTKNK